MENRNARGIGQPKIHGTELAVPPYLNVSVWLNVALLILPVSWKNSGALIFFFYFSEIWEFLSWNPLNKYRICLKEKIEIDSFSSSTWTTRDCLEFVQYLPLELWEFLYPIFEYYICFKYCILICFCAYYWRIWIEKFLKKL